MGPLPPTTNQPSNERLTEVVLTKNGHSIKAFKDDLITRKIKTRGIYENGPLSLAAKILNKIERPVVLDIGANIGNHALSFALSAHQVHAFEPVNITFSLLQENIARNKLTNLHCYNYGLSDVAMTADIFVDRAGNIGGSSLEYRGIGATTEAIELVCGDDWVASPAHCIDTIDFIKIDVEGHESNVVIGLKNSLLTHRPIVMMEYNADSNVQAFKQMNIFETCFPHYEVFVLGNNYDRAYHEGKTGVKFRRFLTRLLFKKSVKLYSFNPKQLYHNIMLVPHEKLSLLPKECLT